MNYIRFITRKFNNVSIKNKLLISYIVIFLAPVLFVGLRLTVGLREMSMNQAVQQATLNVDRIKKMTAEALKVPIDISNKIYLDKNLQTIMSTNFKSTLDVVEAYEDYNDFTDYVRLYKEITNIRFYSYNQTILDNWRFLKVDQSIKSAKWYNEAVNSRGKICFEYIKDETLGDTRFLSLTRLVRDNASNGLGVLVIDVNMNFLNSVLQEEPFETMIISDKGYIVAAKDSVLIGRNINDLAFNDDFIKLDKGIYQKAYNGEPSKIIVDSFYPVTGNTGFKIISIFPIESIMKDANKISVLGIVIIVLSLLIALVFILFFSKVFSSRIKLLSGEMHRVASGDFNITSPIEGDDEIGQLSRDLNSMAKSIDGLMNEVYEINQQKNQLVIKQKEIKLKMLANQINPHFLFNALETIRMKAHCKGENEIAEVVKLLGKLMRKNLEVGNELVTIGEELEMVRSYLEIQKFRYSDKVNYKINVDEKLKNCKILPLVIQPMVENAVVHGLENKEGMGTVIVNIDKIGNFLEISVIDDGLGIDSKKMDEVLGSLDEIEEDKGRRIGLRNVHQRIRLYYGADFGLDVYSREGFGTKIDILLPAEG